MTLVASPGIGDLGAWLEQLLAESTGKQGKGIIPVDREALGAPERVRPGPPLRLPAAGVGAGRWPGRGRRGAGEGRASGRAHRGRGPLRPGPGVLPLGDRHRRGRRGPGHQPLRPARRRGEQDRDPEADRGVREDRLAAGRDAVPRGRAVRAVRRPGATPQALQAAARRWRDVLRAHLERARGGRLLRPARLHPDDQRARGACCRRCACGVRDAQTRRHLPRLRAAVPALHRPGLQGRAELAACSCRSPATIRRDLPVPGQKYTFGVVKAAQARGDFEVLAARKRRALRVHLRGPLDAALRTLREAIDRAV